MSGLAGSGGGRCSPLCAGQGGSPKQAAPLPAPAPLLPARQQGRASSGQSTAAPGDCVGLQVRVFFRL